jgi:RNA 2',3'-cyclic 3'-phosphodiesterase
VRLFVAINLPADVRRRAYEAAAPLRAAAPRAAWVAEENLHLTLKFLRDVSEEVAAGLIESLGAVAGRSRALSLEFTEFGAFPSLRRPRVVWAGVAPDPKLELLSHDVEVVCEAHGFEVEGRAFRPHVTLGRVKVISDDEARALARGSRSAQLHAVCTVSTVDLMRSELTPRGARYTVLAALPLGAARDAPPFTPLRSA